MAAGVDEKYGEELCRSVGLLAASDGTSDAEVQQLCAGAYTRCAVNPPKMADDCLANATCTATVTDYKACVAEYPTYLDQFIAGLPVCAELTMANLKAAQAFEPAPTPACAGVWMQCNGTF